MSEWKEWLKEKKNKILILKLVLTFCFPLFLCMFYCLREGAWIGDLHLASAQNNDILFYYKQVDGMVKYGVPQGFFGFNESQAQNFSFAAWSPVMLLPWALWGKLFGWTGVSPFVCNILLLSVVLALVVYWRRPNAKQMLACAGMIALFPAITRYLMSCLAETIIVSFVLLFYGLAIGYVRKESGAKLVGLFLIAGFLTWMRPYMVLLLLLPGVFLISRKRWVGVAVTGVAMLVNLVVYFLISALLTADYFEELYNWNLITAFKSYGFEGGLYNFVYCIRGLRDGLIECIKLSFTKGAFLGSNYCVLLLLLLLVSTLLWKRNADSKEKQYVWIIAHYLLTSVVSVVALLLLMQKINETSRHIMSFVLVGMVLLGCMADIKVKNVWKPLLVIGLCVYLYHVFPDDGHDYQVPVFKQERYEEEIAWREISEKIELDITGTPSFDNTLIWVFSDKVGEEIVYMSWHHMLTVPAGMGISCCKYDYLVENWENVKSRYITTLADGAIAQMCEASGFEKLGEANGKVVYKRY